MGVPTLGCRCRTCTSPDPRDNRMRPSIAISWGAPVSAGEPAHRVSTGKPVHRVSAGESAHQDSATDLAQRLSVDDPTRRDPAGHAAQQNSTADPAHRVVIDTGPEFRVQALRANIHHLDAVFYTHAHADHILGLDDLRPLSYLYHRANGRTANLPLYADDETAAVLERIFDYTFSPHSTYPNKARVTLHRIAGDQAVDVAGIPFRRIPLMHGRQHIAGYRFGNAAYLTDMSSIPDASLALLEGLDVLILDALRHEHHPSHANIDEALQWVERIAPRRAFFTHMSHELHHADTEAILPGHVRLAYDGLQLTFSLNGAC